MKTNTSKVVVALSLLLCLRLPGAAATIQAKVIQVESGNTLVVSNISRPVRVRLKGVVPPESGQPFSEAARDHLKALVMDKAVFVEYTHLMSGYLESKIVLNGIDIGSQMLRDGVAWYDRAAQYGLPPSDRELYAQCEQLARNEKRGLWQDPSPVSPWDFRLAQQLKPSRTSTAPESFSARQSLRSKPSNRMTGFSNYDLPGGMVGPGSIAGSPTFTPVAPNSAPDDWVVYQSTAPRFSISVPGNSYHYEYPVLDGQKKIVTINYVIGLSEDGVYTLMWTQGSNDNATDASAADSSIQGFIKGFNQYFETKEREVNLRATVSNGRYVKFGAYAGKQYTLAAGPLTGVARVVSRQIGDQREIFMLAVFDAPGSNSGTEFLNSLKISTK